MAIVFSDARYVPRGGSEGLGVVTRGPVTGSVTTLFGVKDDLHPDGHSGLDIGSTADTPVLLPADAICLDVFSLALASREPWIAHWKEIFGNSAIFLVGDFVTLFAHLAAPPSVREGQRYVAGVEVGRVGDTGYSFGPHLHWGLAPAANRYLERSGVLLNPLDYFGTDAAPLAVAEVEAHLSEAREGVLRTSTGIDAAAAALKG